MQKVRLLLFLKKSKTLLVFKNLEDCAIWKDKNIEPKEVQDIMDCFGAKECKYIYFVKDNAYLQVIGHNKDENDPGRGYNIYSLKWLFETYFCSNEYVSFENALNSYIIQVHNCIGYNTMKTLTPGALINFRKITENEISKYPYDLLVDKQVKNHILELVELDKIKKQFFQEKSILGLLGDSDFAESFITAEWLFYSMKKAQAIDLTVIGMGYFKAVEQLLYKMICLHKNEGRKIKTDYSRRDLPKKIDLNDLNIYDKAVDITIGSMAVFYRDNLDIFRDSLSWETRKYILETIFEYKNLRNEYFHKDNIRGWNKIIFIRNVTIELLFLLLGGKTLKYEDKVALGFSFKFQSDFHKLCEYVHYHHAELFFLDFGDGNEEIVWGQADPSSRVIDGLYVEYSGVYFKQIESSGKTYRFISERLPKKISLGKFVFGYSNKVEINTVKIKTIYEDGKFVGPSIAEEEQLNY
jgi:hypothetical protein